MVLRLLILGMFSSTCLKTLLLHYFYLEIIRFYTVVCRYRHMYLTSIGWHYYGIW